jgi:hypothetical protein
VLNAARGVGQDAATVALVHPCGVAFGVGRVFVADSTSVRAVDPATGRLTTPAGTGAAVGPWATAWPSGQA